MKSLIKKTAEGAKGDAPTEAGGQQAGRNNNKGTSMFKAVQEKKVQKTCSAQTVSADNNSVGQTAWTMRRRNNMVDFMKYPSLMNAGNLTAKDLLSWSQYTDGEWYATEKLHGANFSYTFDGHTLTAGRRNGFLSEDDKFYAGWKDIEAELYCDWQKLFSGYMLPDEAPQPKSVTVFGELIGSPFTNMGYFIADGLTGPLEADWRVFSIMIPLEDNTIWVAGRDFLREHFTNDSLVPQIASGKLLELLDVLDLEAGSALGEKSEGYVLMPAADRFWHPAAGAFPAVKHKTAEFSEVKYSREKLGSLAEATALDGYVTFARFENVLSHGDVTLARENIRSLIDLLADDVFSEYERENGPVDRSKYEKGVKGKCGWLISQRLRARDVTNTEEKE